MTEPRNGAATVVPGSVSRRDVDTCPAPLVAFLTKAIGVRW